MAKTRATLPVNTPIEIWWQDEARVGQKTKITRRWAKRGTRPRAPKDQRTKSAWIFGAICPARGVGAALILIKQPDVWTFEFMPISHLGIPI